MTINETYIHLLHYCRYNHAGFVEELPQLPETRWNHACAALPSTKVRPLPPMMSHFKAIIVAGGLTSNSSFTSSVIALVLGASDWTPLASLPRPWRGAGAVIVGGKMWVSGGVDGGSSIRDEVSS